LISSDFFKNFFGRGCYDSIFTFTFLPIQTMNIYYDYFSEQTVFYIVLSFERTIERCTCIVLFYLLSDDSVEQWFTIVLSSRLFIVFTSI